MSVLFVVGASTGGVGALQKLAAALPADLEAAVLVVLHVGAHRSILPEILTRAAKLPACHAAHGEAIQGGRIYVAPPDHHMLVDGHRLALTRGPKEHHSRPAIDPLFRTAALTRGAEVVGIVLTGALDDGTAGLQAIKDCGGIAAVQDPVEAVDPSMPRSALRHVDIDYTMPLDGLASLIGRLAKRKVERTMEHTPKSLQDEQAIADGKADALETLRRLGKPSTFSCPDCHGALWQINGARPVRYRCHTGHAFSERSLLETLSLLCDDAMWNSVRALQEQAFLMRSMAEHAGAGQGDSFAADIAALEQRIDALRKMVEGGRPAGG